MSTPADKMALRHRREGLPYTVSCPACRKPFLFTTSISKHWVKCLMRFAPQLEERRAALTRVFVTPEFDAQMQRHDDEQDKRRLP